MSQRQFDPSKHLTLVSGREYLEVKWRLVWLRSEFPKSRIETELVSHKDNEAVFKATVELISNDGEICGSATGWGSENARGFGDYLEKAETKAIGRALAACGFGTQFTSDFDYDATNQRVVDAPVANQQRRQQQVNSQPRQVEPGAGVTEKQTQLIRELREQLRWSKEDLDAMSRQSVGVTITQLDRRSASTLIENLKAQIPPPQR